VDTAFPQMGHSESVLGFPLIDFLRERGLQAQKSNITLQLLGLLPYVIVGGPDGEAMLFSGCADRIKWSRPSLGCI
jgi:hypothetical protein